MMHTPDGFITGWICVVMALFSLTALAYALYKLRINKNQIIQMSFLGLLVFAAQMLNFPIASGTSGHLIGAALVAILLGPHAAVVVLALVLLVQCIVFGDGGIFALGVNTFIMAVLASYSAHFIYKKLEKTPSIAVIAASWTSVVLASVVLSVLLALSNLAPFTDILIAMASTHAFIGIGEGLISLCIFASFNKAKFPNIAVSYHFLAAFALVFLVFALSLPFASSAPDGLERVALRLGFYSNANVIYQAPFAEYVVFGSELTAGLLGMLATFAIIAFFGYLIQITRIDSAKCLE